MARWYYLRTAPGTFTPFSEDDMTRFLEGTLAVPGGDLGRVDYAGLEVAEERGVPVAVDDVWFGRCRVLDDGLLDRVHMLDVVNAKRALAADVEASMADLPPGLAELDATNRFQARWTSLQSRWDPEPADVDALRRLVNARAGSALL